MHGVKKTNDIYFVNEWYIYITADLVTTTIVFCSSIEYVTITISIIIRHNNYKLIEHNFTATAHLHRMSFTVQFLL